MVRTCEKGGLPNSEYCLSGLKENLAILLDILLECTYTVESLLDAVPATFHALASSISIIHSTQSTRNEKLRPKINLLEDVTKSRSSTLEYFLSRSREGLAILLILLAIALECTYTIELLLDTVAVMFQAFASSIGGIHSTQRPALAFKEVVMRSFASLLRTCRERCIALLKSEYYLNGQEEVLANLLILCTPSTV